MDSLTKIGKNGKFGHTDYDLYVFMMFHTGGYNGASLDTMTSAYIAEAIEGDDPEDDGTDAPDITEGEFLEMKKMNTPIVKQITM